MPNNLDAFIPELWSTAIVQKVRQINVMLPLVNRDYEGEIKKAGDQVWVRTFGRVTIQPYRRGQPLSYESLQPTKEPMTVNDSQSFSFLVDDLDTAQNDINALDGYTKEAAVSLNECIEAKLQSYYAKAPTANQVTNSGSPWSITSSNAYSVLTKAQMALDNQNVPQSGRWAVLTPAYKQALVNDPTFVSRSTDLGDGVVTSGMIMSADGGFIQRTVAQAQETGYFGHAAGFDLYLSTAAPVDATQRYCQFGQGAPISYASQIREMEAIRLESTFATAIRGLLLHDAAIFAEYTKRFGYIAIAPNQ